MQVEVGEYMNGNASEQVVHLSLSPTLSLSMHVSHVSEHSSHSCKASPLEVNPASHETLQFALPVLVLKSKGV